MGDRLALQVSTNALRYCTRGKWRARWLAAELVTDLEIRRMMETVESKVAARGRWDAVDEASDVVLTPHELAAMQWDKVDEASVVLLTPHELAAMRRLLGGSETSTMLEDVAKAESRIGGYIVSPRASVGEAVAVIELALAGIPRVLVNPWTHLVRDAYRRAVSSRIALSRRVSRHFGVQAYVDAIATAVLVMEVPMWCACWERGAPPEPIVTLSVMTSGEICVLSQSAEGPHVGAWRELEFHSLVATKRRAAELVTDAEKGRVRADLVAQAFGFLPSAPTDLQRLELGESMVVREEKRPAAIESVEDIVKVASGGVTNSNSRKILKWVDAAIYGNVVGGEHAWGSVSCS